MKIPSLQRAPVVNGSNRNLALQLLPEHETFAQCGLPSDFNLTCKSALITHPVKLKHPKLADFRRHETYLFDKNRIYLGSL